jgi:hypothetical protein
MLVYGRYAEPVTPPLLALGVSTLARRPSHLRLARPLAVIAVATVLVVVLRATLGSLDPSAQPNRFNVASLPFITSDLGAAVLAGAGIVAAAALMFLRAVGHRSPAMTAPMLLCLLAPTTVFVEIRGVLAEEQRVYPRGWSSPAAAVAAERVTAIAYDQDQGLSVAKVYQWFLPDTRSWSSTVLARRRHCAWSSRRVVDHVGDRTRRRLSSGEIPLGIRSCSGTVRADRSTTRAAPWRGDRPTRSATPGAQSHRARDYHDAHGRGGRGLREWPAATTA